MLRCILIGLVTVGALADTVVINEVVDKLLDSAKSVLILKGQNKISLKNITKKFNSKVLGAKIPGTFVASGGLLHGLTTLHRTGNALLTTEGNKMKLKFAMGFSSLSVEYGHYDFKFMLIESNGSIVVSTSGTSVLASIWLVKEGAKCIAGVNSARLQTFGKTKVTFAGPQVLNRFLSIVLNWVLENCKNMIKFVVNFKLRDALKAALTKPNVCALLPF